MPLRGVVQPPLRVVLHQRDEKQDLEMKTLKRVPVQLVRVCYGLDEVCSAVNEYFGNGHDKN